MCDGCKRVSGTCDHGKLMCVLGRIARIFCSQGHVKGCTFCGQGHVDGCIFCGQGPVDGCIFCGQGH
eukprot:1161245-Pelagomonas_calceolata.AAC.1